MFWLMHFHEIVILFSNSYQDHVHITEATVKHSLYQWIYQQDEFTDYGTKVSVQ